MTKIRIKANRRIVFTSRNGIQIMAITMVINDDTYTFLHALLTFASSNSSCRKFLNAPKKAKKPKNPKKPDSIKPNRPRNPR